MSEERFKQLRSGSIRERLAFVAKDSVVYGSAAALSSLLNLLLLPFLTRLFSKAEYGALDGMMVLGTAFIAFIIMGQDSSIARYFYETEDPEERKQIISQALFTELFLCTAVTALVWFNAGRLLEAAYGMEEYADFFRVMVLSFPFVVLVRFSSNLLKWTFDRSKFILISIGSAAGVIAVTLFYVLKLELGMKGYFYGQLTGFGFFSLLGLWFCRGYITVPRGFDHGAKMLSYGGPYMVTAVATCLIPAVDRIMIANYVGLDANGLYAIGYRYAFMLMLPIQAIMTAWVPFTLAIYKEPDAEETYNRGLILMTAGLAVVSVIMISMVEPIIELVASARYLPGHVVALPLILGLVIQNITHIARVGITLSKQTRYTMYSYMIGIVASAVAIWLLVQPFGILGAAYGALLGKLAQSTSYVGFAYKVYPMRFGMMRPSAMVLLAAGAGLALQLIAIEATWTLIAYRIAVVALFMTLVWFVMFNASDRQRTVQTVMGYLGRGSSET